MNNISLIFCGLSQFCKVLTLQKSWNTTNVRSINPYLITYRELEADFLKGIPGHKRWAFIRLIIEECFLP
jgi:hypothetical protein